MVVFGYTTPLIAPASIIGLIFFRPFIGICLIQKVR